MRQTDTAAPARRGKMPAPKHVAPEADAAPSRRDAPKAATAPRYADRDPSTGRVVALGRDGKPLSRTADNYGDKFHVPNHFREAGWDLQWMREAVYGQPDPSNINNMKQNGWAPVDPAKFPGMSVRLDGLALYERPIALTIEAREEERKLASAQMRQNTPDRDAKLGVYEDGRNNPEARANTFVKRHIEGLPDDLAAPRYEYGEAED